MWSSSKGELNIICLIQYGSCVEWILVWVIYYKNQIYFWQATYYIKGREYGERVGKFQNGVELLVIEMWLSSKVQLIAASTQKVIMSLN